MTVGRKAKRKPARSDPSNGCILTRLRTSFCHITANEESTAIASTQAAA